MMRAGSDVRKNIIRELLSCFNQTELKIWNTTDIKIMVCFIFLLFSAFNGLRWGVGGGGGWD